MTLEWYNSTATHEVKEVQTDASPTTVFLRRNIHTVEQEDPLKEITSTIWVYEEAQITHEQYEQMLTEELARVTPYTVTKNAYIDDTEVIFTDVPDGNMSVYVKDNEGNYPAYTVERTGNIVTIHFEPLETVTTVTISVL